jgi:hypothetical protein
MSSGTESTRLSRRELTRLLGGALAFGSFGATSAFAQSCAALPSGMLPRLGNVQVTDLEVTVNNVNFSPCQPRRRLLPGFTVHVAANNGVCTLELAGGIVISVKMTLAAVRGAPAPIFFGKLGFEQFTQYTNQRAPAGLGAGSGQLACSRSVGWELDSGGPSDTYNGLFSCVPGPNQLSCVFDPRNPNSKSEMADDPGVPTEDASTAYDRVWAGIKAPNLFRTWVVWDDDNPATPPRVRRHPLARIDWAWQAQAGMGGTDCTSVVASHPGASWGSSNASGSVTGVFFGAAAGALPTRFSRTHNITWLSGKC